MIAVILDRRPGFLEGASDNYSILTLPMASSSVLDQWLTRIVNSVEGDLLVLPTFAHGPGYAEQVAENTAFEVKITDGPALAARLRDADPADRVLVLDPTLWPTDGYSLEQTLNDTRGYRGATHAVAMGRNSDRTRERVDCDAQGFVKRVRRLYSRVAWPEAGGHGVFLTMAPASAVAEIPFGTLTELRSGLAQRGVLNRDEPVSSDLLDLTTLEGFLAAHERATMLAVGADAPLGFSSPIPEVLVGEGVAIDPTAKMVGPVIIYPKARIEAGVRIIGPTVVGTASHLKNDSVVAHSVLASGTDIPEGATVRHQVAFGHWVKQPALKDRTQQTIRITAPSLGGYSAGDDDRHVQAQHIPRFYTAHLGAKRALDVVLAATGLVVLSPLLLLAALAIKLDSRGPVLFGHRRERRGGQEFSCLKFRTMVPGADRLQKALADRNEVDGPQFKMDNDPRVTRVGKILRATNIDELPQLINVLKGDMSLVGPRPSPFRENQICVPWRRARLSVRPGITGLWQICRGNRSQADFNQWIYYDIIYVRNFSIWMDFRILAATILTLGGKWSVPLSWITGPEPRNGRNPSGSPARLKPAGNT